jgi:hypothetical protein
MLAQEHPDLFAEAVKYEQEHSDGRQYTWTAGETLLDLLERKDEIIAEYERSTVRQKQTNQNRSLVEILMPVFEDNEDMLLV